MNKSLLLYFCPFLVQAEDVELVLQEKIAYSTAIESTMEAEINALLGEDPYIDETDWSGNKVPTKRDYSKKIKKS
mgnify:CR=1 FL=1